MIFWVRILAASGKSELWRMKLNIGSRTTHFGAAILSILLELALIRSYWLVNS